MKALLPWLVVLAVVFLLSTVHLRIPATLVAVGWLGYCAYTWIRPGRRRQVRR